MKVELDDEEWKAILFILQKTPNLPVPLEVSHPILMKIGEQLRKQTTNVMPIRK